ncbi:MAG TPA: hypothetical protein VML75_17035 [Kofleriaceae bacterium]|nr:hypothetical protein [Kofleriaceae bacterium]
MKPSRARPLLTAAIVLSIAALAGTAVAQPDDDGSDGDGIASGEVDPGPAAVPPGDGAADLEALRKKYLELRDQLFRSRARAAAVASALYSSKLRVQLDYTSARYYSVGRATIRLDGSNIFDDTEGAIAGDKATRFEGFVAPGRHQLSIRIEATGKDDGRFTSVMEHTFVIDAVAGHDLIVRATARDDGDIPYQWQRKQRGSYQLRLDVNVEAIKRQGAKDAAVAKSK